MRLRWIGVLAAFARVIKWARSKALYSRGVIFGMTVDDPDVTPRHLYRYEACVASDSPFEGGDGISRLKMPAMRYAATRVSGDLRWVATAWDYLIRSWLINKRL